MQRNADCSDKGANVTYEEYYDAISKYLFNTCKDYMEVFEEGKKLKKAVEAAIQHAAVDKWFGVEEGER